MSHWDKLPDELRKYIKSIVVVQIIQKKWRGHHCRTTCANIIANKYANKAWNTGLNCSMLCLFYHTCDCNDPKMMIEIEYCAKNAWVCNKTTIWKNFIQNIEQNLWKNRYTEASCTQIYHRIEQAKRKLQQRLKVASYGAPHWATYWHAPRYWDHNGNLCDDNGILWASPGRYHNENRN